MTVRVRGIYATALTALFDDVVQPSPPISRRFDTTFPVEPADVTVGTTGDRLGVGVHGEREAVTEAATRLEGIGRDTFVWSAALPRGAVYAGEVTETLGGGALVTCGEEAVGFLPYSKTARHVETGDRLRVQVDEPQPPWSDSRPILDTDVRVHGTLATLVRGGRATGGQPELADVLPTATPDGWAVDWAPAADDADLDALDATLGAIAGRAGRLDEALTDAPPPTECAPHRYWAGDATRWVLFGRESRFALDEKRREVTATMAGHHRSKAATGAAGAAVDFVEAVCESAGGDGFPFDALTRQFGPREGESLAIGHGKPDGRRIELGPGTVTTRTADGKLTLERELRPGGTYDAIGGEIQSGDVAITKFEEGRWWYPTVYRGADGTRRGTYVNICTPVEIFPNEVRYVDLHVDVIKGPDGAVEQVDGAELADAVAEGHVQPDLATKARGVADAVANAL
ncbi:MAG: DUF402 domain-containing protein [Halovenus sp.]